MPAYPKNYPFYNWVPKPIGIIILFMFFLPILTVGGTYSASGTEMMSGLGIISEHIQFANFATSIGMAAFCRATIIMKTAVLLPSRLFRSSIKTLTSLSHPTFYLITASHSFIRDLKQLCNRSS